MKVLQLRHQTLHRKVIHKMKKLIYAKLAALNFFFTKVYIAFAEQPTVWKLLPRSGEDETVRGNYQETGAVADLPKVSLEGAGTTVIKTILGWGSVFAIIAVVAAGVYYIIARGKEEDVTKAKNILLYLIVGMVIMASAYAIVSGIVQFRIFEN